MDEALTDGEAFVRWHARKLLEAAEDAPCFTGWELGELSRGFVHESVASYERLAGKHEAIRYLRAILDQLEGAA